MKCCKKIFFLFLLLPVLAFAQVTEKVDTVFPLRGQSAIKNGEIYYVQIQSEKDNEELKQFVSKKINALMFVMGLKERDGKRLFEVFIMDPPTDQKSAKKIETLFEPVGFNFQYVKNPPLFDFLKIDTPYTYKEHINLITKVLVGIFILIMAIPLFVWGRRFLVNKSKTKAEKKHKKKQAQQYLELIQNAKERTDFEKIYLARKEISNLLDLDRSLFTKFLREVDAIQYQKDWTLQDWNTMKERLKSIQDCRVNRGI